MRTRLVWLGVLMVIGLVASPLQADDLTGANRILCTAVQATVCAAEGDCEIAPPWTWNIPQFIEIDLTRNTLATTKASGESRSTPIRNAVRDQGLVFLQGVEAGRAFSFVIAEATGMASIAVAREGVTVSVFGACTPMAR